MWSALDDRGAIVLRQKKWSRGQIEARLANLPPCLIGMEACVGAHHLSRKLKALGHDARLMPYACWRSGSADFRDAEAIAEAVQRRARSYSSTKTAEQLDLQALHQLRSGWSSAHRHHQSNSRLSVGSLVWQSAGLRFLRAELPRILATPP